MTDDARLMLDSMSTRLAELATTVVQLSAKVDANRNEQQSAERHAASELKAIKDQATLTNGRVNGLEQWKDRLLGAAAAIGLVWTVATDVFGLLPK